MKFIVHVEKDGIIYKCQAYPNPYRYKCGRCRRGKVFWQTDKGTIEMASRCAVCTARVKVWTYMACTHDGS